MRRLTKVRHVSRFLPYLSYCLRVDMDKLISMHKKKALEDFIEKYPSITHFETLFELEKASKTEICEAVEGFKIDGRYIYKGEFVSREYIEEELSKVDTKLITTICFMEADK